MVRKKFTKKEIVIGISCALVIVPLLTFYIWHQVEVIRLGYEIQKLQQTVTELTKDVETLEAEKTALLSLDRIEAIAVERLGYRPPREGQIVHDDKIPEE